MRRFAPLTVLLVALLLLRLTACSGASANRVRVATFNAGLAPGDVDYVEERLPHVIDTLASSDADVLCVQEFWRTEDWEALREATRERFPHVVRRDAEPQQAACTTEELDPLEACARSECPGLAGAELQDCALASCGDEVGGLEPACLNCAVEQVGAGAGIDTIGAECEGEGGAGYVYDAFDNAILTDRQVLRQDSLVLDSYAVHASVEYAELDTDAGPLHVFCTHLASGIGAVEYEGEHGSWEREQARQVQQLVAFVEDKTRGSGAAVLMGDLNNRPAVPAAGMEAKWGDNYAQLTASGWTNPWLEDPDVACTSCPDNTFKAADKPPTINDHVLVRDLSGKARCERAFTETVDVEVEGETVTTHLSDHYGLACRISP